MAKNTKPPAEKNYDECHECGAPVGLRIMKDGAVTHKDGCSKKVARVELTAEQKIETLVTRLKNHLENDDLDEVRQQFAKALDTGSLSYAIRWHGYSAFLAEALEGKLIGLRGRLEKIVAEKVSVVLSLRDWLEEVRKDAAAELLKSWNVEWDSSTCPFSNQESKAKARALQIVHERAGHGLNAIEFLLENSPELR